VKRRSRRSRDCGRSSSASSGESPRSRQRPDPMCSASAGAGRVNCPGELQSSDDNRGRNGSLGCMDRFRGLALLVPFSTGHGPPAWCASGHGGKVRPAGAAAHPSPERAPGSHEPRGASPTVTDPRGRAGDASSRRANPGGECSRIAAPARNPVDDRVIVACGRRYDGLTPSGRARCNSR